MITPTPQYFLHHATSRKLLRKKLDESSLVVIRPGVSERQVVLYGQLFTEKIWCCQDCKDDNFEAPILKDDIWKRIAPDDGMMCLKCMEVHLGRHLVYSDLKNPEKGAINKMIVLLLRK